MKYPWIDEYLLEKRGVTKDLQKDWNWIRYQIGGKMFAAVLLDDDDHPYYVNLKLEPAEGELLRREFPDIIPGYYSNKQHWNSVKADGEVPDELLRALLDRSFQLVLRGLPKKQQRLVLGLSVCGTSCADCPYFGSLCGGCNETDGKVFHARDGKPCPIFACCVNRHHYASCAQCGELICGVWRGTRDPSMTDAEFEKSLSDRASLLRTAYGKEQPSGK